MILDYNDGVFSTVRASDVDRDGIGLELNWFPDGRTTIMPLQVAEIFYSDKDGSFTLTTFDQKVPLEVIEKFIAAAKASLPTRSSQG